MNFTTVKTAILRNTGQNHAYFQVGQQTCFSHISKFFISMNNPCIYCLSLLVNLTCSLYFFKVFDVYPLPGMTVIPAEGVVPVGGYTELQILFSPNAAMKFDTRVEVCENI